MEEKAKKPQIDENECSGCGLCMDECEDACLELIDDIAKLIKPENCTGCGKCEEACPSEAITLA